MPGWLSLVRPLHEGSYSAGLIALQGEKSGGRGLEFPTAVESPAPGTYRILVGSSWLVETRTLLHRDDGLATTGTPGETIADLELLVIARFLQSKGNVLDLGCGRGRSSVYLNLQGFDAIGVEINVSTLNGAQRLNRENGASCEFVRADGRHLCFRDECFDYVVSFGSTLSEKYRLWLEREDRLEMISEAIRVTRSGGVVLVNFVHRYWSLGHSLSFMKYYLDWAREKVLRRRTEIGDYTEVIGDAPVRFHAFTIREAVQLFPRKGIRLSVWRKYKGLFSDWFFVLARKTAEG